MIELVSDHFSDRTSHLPLRTLHQAIDSASNPLEPLPHYPWPGGMREAIRRTSSAGHGVLDLCHLLGSAFLVFLSKLSRSGSFTPAKILPAGPRIPPGRAFQQRFNALGPHFFCIVF